MLIGLYVGLIRVSQHRVLEPQGVPENFKGLCEKFQGKQIITKVYVNYDIGVTWIRKIIYPGVM